MTCTPGAPGTPGTLGTPGAQGSGQPNAVEPVVTPLLDLQLDD